MMLRMPASAGPQVIEVHDPELIERVARRDLGLHLYELGDLDPFFWPHTRWYGLADPGETSGELSALVLLYTGAALPTVLALGRRGDEALATLLTAIAPRLPARACPRVRTPRRTTLATGSTAVAKAGLADTAAGTRRSR